jgi:two-component system, NarL family, nitrate/nitrite response regulator NarL
LNVITVAVIDDHPLFREGVSSALLRYDDIAIVGQGETAQEAIALAAGFQPEVLLLDISIPGGGGLDMIGGILAASPSTKVVMLTASEEIEMLAASLRRGARGDVVKGVGIQELIKAIRQVVHGSRYLSASMSAKVTVTLANQSTLRRTLTEREREIIALVAEGLTNKQIASRIDVQEKTVKHHMTEVLKKLSVTNRTEAALRWRGIAGAPSSHQVKVLQKER